MASQKNHGSNDFDPVERFNKRTKCNNQQQFFLPQMQHNISQQKSFTSPPSTPQLRSLHFNPTQTAPSPNPNVNVNDDDDEEGSEYRGYDDDFINNYVTESLNMVRTLQKQANKENIQQTASGLNPPPPVSADDQENTTTSSFSPETFIELVRQYPCIWNVKLNVYKDQTKKKIAWTHIKDILGGFHTSEPLNFLFNCHRYV